MTSGSSKLTLRVTTPPPQNGNQQAWPSAFNTGMNTFSNGDGATSFSINELNVTPDLIYTHDERLLNGIVSIDFGNNRSIQKALFKEGKLQSGILCENQAQWEVSFQREGSFTLCLLPDKKRIYTGELNKKLEKSGRGEMQLPSGNKFVGSYSDGKSIHGTMHMGNGAESYTYSVEDGFAKLGETVTYNKNCATISIQVSGVASSKELGEKIFQHGNDITVTIIDNHHQQHVTIQIVGKYGGTFANLLNFADCTLQNNQSNRSATLIGAVRLDASGLVTQQAKLFCHPDDAPSYKGFFSSVYVEKIVVSGNLSCQIRNIYDESGNLLTPESWKQLFNSCYTNSVWSAYNATVPRYSMLYASFNTAVQKFPQPPIKIVRHDNCGFSVFAAAGFPESVGKIGIAGMYAGLEGPISLYNVYQLGGGNSEPVVDAEKLRNWTAMLASLPSEENLLKLEQRLTNEGDLKAFQAIKEHIARQNLRYYSMGAELTSGCVFCLGNGIKPGDILGVDYLSTAMMEIILNPSLLITRTNTQMKVWSRTGSPIGIFYFDDKKYFRFQLCKNEQPLEQQPRQITLPTDDDILKQMKDLHTLSNTFVIKLSEIKKTASQELNESINTWGSFSNKRNNILSRGLF